MSHDMILTPDEIKDITGKVKPGWQKRELDFLGIPSKRRSDGSLLVFWSDVHASREPVKAEPRVRSA